MKSEYKKILKYVEPIFRFCLKRLASRQEAEELSQEILTHVLSGINKYEIDNLEAWVWQIAHNRYARHIDNKNNRNEISFGHEYLENNKNDYNLLQELVVKEKHQYVFNALHTLSNMYRKILVDYYVYELSVKKIADKYNLAETTIKWRLHAGREKIKERMDNMKNTKKIYDRINWKTTTCNGRMDSNKYLGSQIARAICLAAYEKPVTIEEISVITGIPALYIEDELENLIYGDAIVKKGKKYSTNFIILRQEDNKKMIKEFKPYISDISKLMQQYLSKNNENIKKIGFYGCNFGIDKLGYIAVPLTLRKAIKEIQNSNEKLQYGPYPPRKDGGFGWFIVRETEDEKENPQPSAS